VEALLFDAGHGSSVIAGREKFDQFVVFEGEKEQKVLRFGDGKELIERPIDLGSLGFHMD